MANPSRNKGTAAETAVVRWMRSAGFPGADRQPLRGGRDAGDLILCPGVVAEVKAHRSASTGQPGPALLAEWMWQAETERLNADALWCPLIVKRKGTTDVGAWFAYVTADAAANLLDARVAELPNPDAPICMTVASLAELLRVAGYGTPLPSKDTA